MGAMRKTIHMGTGCI